MITREKRRVTANVERFYINGLIDTAAFIELLGYVPNQELKKAREKASA